MNYLFIHGFKTTGDDMTWMQSLKEKVIEKNPDANVNIPNFPNSARPKYSEWINFAQKFISNKNIIIGHSLGGFVALKLAEIIKIKHLILVAPGYLRPDQRQEYIESSKRPVDQKLALLKFYEDAGDIDVNKINNNAESITILYSNEDSKIRSESKNALAQKLDQIKGKVTIQNLNNYGHFMPIEGVHKVTELEKLLVGRE